MPYAQIFGPYCGSIQPLQTLNLTSVKSAMCVLNAFTLRISHESICRRLSTRLLVVVVQEIKSAQTAAQIKLEEKAEKYTAPVIAHQHIAQPVVNVAELSDEDKKALLRELLK